MIPMKYLKNFNSMTHARPWAACLVVALAILGPSCGLKIKSIASNAQIQLKNLVTVAPGATGLLPGVCEPVSIAFKPEFSASSVAVSLSFYEGTGSFYSDSACATPITSVTGSASQTAHAFVKINSVTAVAIRASAAGTSDSYSVLPVRGFGIAPSSVWGQPSAFENIHVKMGMNGPLGIAVSGSRLYVAEYGNHRITYFNSIPTSNHAQPDGVIGHDSMSIPDMIEPVANAKSLGNPHSIASDGTHFAVAEYQNHRVKIWNSLPTANTPADVVLGTPSFSNTSANFGGISAKSMYAPVGVKFLNGKLVVADYAGHRVMIWNSVPTSDFTAADIILGQATATTQTANLGGLSASTMNLPMDVEWDGTRFYVADAGNNRVLAWNTFPTTTGQPADVVLGQANLTTNTANAGGLSATSLAAPDALHVSGTTLWVNDRGNTRLLSYDVSSGPTTNQAAIRVLGKPNFTTNSNSGTALAGEISSSGRIATSGTKLIFADYSNNRVLIWNNPTADGQAADIVLGQPTFGANKANNSGVSATRSDGIHGISSDGTHVALASYTENRVLIWNSVAGYLAGGAADVVVGQPDFSAVAVNNGGISGSSLNRPTDVIFYGSKMAVADYQNHRVLIWNSIPTVNGQAADVAVGQPGLATGSANNGGLTVGLNAPHRLGVDVSGNLYVADYSNHRVVGYSGFPAASGAAATLAFGQSSTNTNAAGTSLSEMNRPTSVRIAAGKLIVTEYGNARVLIFNSIPLASGATADVSLSTNTNVSGLSAGSIMNPWDTAYDGSKFYVLDRGDKRVLVYNGIPTSSSAEATWVAGRPHFLENRTFPPTVDERLEDPCGIGIVGTQLAVADYGRGRVINFDPTTFSNSGVLLSSAILRTLPSSSLLPAQQAAANGNYATCKAVRNAHPNAMNGNYALDLDQNGATAKREVYCDMSNGGYLEVIGGADTPLAQLDLFGDTSQLAATFYSDPNHGIGWGAKEPAAGGSNPWPAIQKCYHVNKTGGAISRIKIRMSSRDEVNVAGGSYGYLEIIRENLGWANWGTFSPYLSANGFLFFVDAWGSSFGSGHNHLSIYADPLQSVYRWMGQVRHHTVEANYAANELYICMGGENSFYNKRYISGLWIR